MSKLSTNIFQSTGFLIALALLLLNDFWWKYTFSNGLTGKLSDFTGLFVFSLFWTFFFPAYRKVIYIGIALFFVFWKSVYADGFIAVWNQICFLQIGRVVDYTDYWAILVLPLAYYYETGTDLFLSNTSFKLHPLPIALLSFFAFTATSTPRYSITFEHPVISLHEINDSVYELEKVNYCKSNSTYQNVEEYLYSQYYECHKLDSLTLFRFHGLMRHGTAYEDQFLRDKIKCAFINDSIAYDHRMRPLDMALFPYYKESIHLKTYLFDELQELNFLNGHLHGTYHKWYDNGKLKEDGYYENGLEHGFWSYYSNTGDKTYEEFYDKGMLKYTRHYNGFLAWKQPVLSRPIRLGLSGLVLMIMAVLWLLVAVKWSKTLANEKKEWYYDYANHESVLLFIAEHLIILFFAVLMALAYLFAITYLPYIIPFFQHTKDGLIIFIILYGLLIFPFIFFFYFLKQRRIEDVCFFFIMLVLSSLLLLQFTFMQSYYREYIQLLN